MHCKYCPSRLSARLTTQVAHVCETIAATPELADGYNAVGFSQGVHVADLNIWEIADVTQLPWHLRGALTWSHDY